MLITPYTIHSWTAGDVPPDALLPINEHSKHDGCSRIRPPPPQVKQRHACPYAGTQQRIPDQAVHLLLHVTPGGCTWTPAHAVAVAATPVPAEHVAYLLTGNVLDAGSAAQRIAAKHG